MDANEYQAQSMRTMNFGPYNLDENEIAIVNCVIGLAGEAGEIADLIKKIVFHGHHMDLKKISGEAGDLLWYVQALCSLCGLKLGDVMQENIDKLAERYPDGFSQERSQERTEYSVSRRDKISLCRHEIDYLNMRCAKCGATDEEINRLRGKGWLHNE
jgi:NTP pyrophosphatase (non-canonical NTP hydrolase)